MDIFRVDGRFTLFMNKLWDLILINILTVLTSLPVLTAGASLTAGAEMLYRLSTDQESAIIAGYFRSFRRNLRKSTPVWCLTLALYTFAVSDLIISASLSTGRSAVAIAATVFLLLLSATQLYLHPILALTDIQGIPALLRSAFLLAGKHLPRTLASGALWLAFLLIYWYYSPAILPLLVFVGYVIPGICWMFIIRGAFPDADAHLRR